MTRLGSIDFQEVASDTLVLGTNKGGWIYSSQRPAYEVRLPAFFIMNEFISHTDVATALGAPIPSSKANLRMEDLTANDVAGLCQTIMESSEFKAFSDTNEGSWEVRLPSESEWYLAHRKGVLALSAGTNERLADGPASNNRGAMMDGRPRPNEFIGPASSQSAVMAIHPRNAAVFAKGTVPSQRPLPGVFARLVLSPIRTEPAKRVPSTTDTWANIRSELLWTTLLGIVPSFAIPIARGMGAYAIDGWFNLFFGGLCAGFITGAIWRPKRPTLRYDEVQSLVEESDSVSQ